MNEFVWLLLPIAALSGWIGARRSLSRKKREPKEPIFNQSHFYESIHYLLNDETDKAVDVLTRLLEINRDTIELHFALGYLFRRRGEVNRAIRLHQGLLSKQGLTSAQRDLTMLELGQDYFRAGLLDRAEAIFQELRSSGEVGPRATELLIDVYQQERDWESARKAAEEYQRATGEDKSMVISHYLCELAEDALDKKDIARAKQFSDSAMSADAKSVRASLLAARIALSESNYDRAIDFLFRVPEQDSRFVNEIATSLAECLRRVTDAQKTQDRVANLLRKIVKDENSNASTVELLKNMEGPRAAIQYVEQKIKPTVSTTMLKKYVALLADEKDASDGLLVRRISAVVNKLDSDHGDYRCERCGFYSRTLFWQCPSCKSWSTIRPVQ